MIHISPAGDSDFDSDSEEEFEFFGSEETFTTVKKLSDKKLQSCVSLTRDSDASILDGARNAQAVNDLFLCDLESAINNNNIEAVKHLLEKEVCSNAVLKSGWSILMHAAYFARNEIVNLLLARGADVNYANSSMDTALHTACKSNVHGCRRETFAIVKALVSGGADPTCQDHTGKTPLMYAARKKLSDAVNFFLELKCAQKNFDLVDEKGWTVADWAATYGSVEILTMLADAGMDVTLDQPSSKLWPENVMKYVRELHFKGTESDLGDQDGALDDIGKFNLGGDADLCALPSEDLMSSSPCDLSNQSNMFCESQSHGNLGAHLDMDKSVKNSDFSHPQKKGTVFNMEETLEDVCCLPAMITRENLQSEQYETYGQLELFLLGLDLSYLIPLFKQQDVRFEQLLCLSMDELKTIGISALGTQKRILSAIHECHEKNSKVSNLPDCTKTPLTTENLLKMMSGVSEQVEYIASFMRYIKYHLDMYPDTLKPEVDAKTDEPPIVTYIEKMNAVSCSVLSLAKSAKYLKIQADNLEEEAADAGFIPPDIVSPAKHVGAEMLKRCNNVTNAALAAGLALSGFFFWRRFKAAG